MKKHIFYLDVLRFIACLAVILIHCSAIIVGGTTISATKGDFYFAHTIDLLVRFAVPVFIMISGALFLSEDYDFKKEKLKKHIIKLVKVYIVWSIFYSVSFHIIKPLLQGHEISAIEALKAIALGEYHMWYIYLIIGLYLIAPILRLWVNKKNIKYVKYSLIVLSIMFFVSTAMVLLEKIFPSMNGLSEHFKVFIPGHVSGYMAYYILGWYLSNIEIRKPKNLYIIAIITFIAILLTSSFLYLTRQIGIDWAYRNFSIHSIICAAAMLVFAKQYFDNKKFAENKKIKAISKNSLGIYLIHPLFIEIFCAIFNAIKLPTILFIPCSFIFVLPLSYFSVSLIKKNSILKEFV